jgi:hypothetical protein
MCAEQRDGENQRAVDMCSLGSEGKIGLTLPACLATASASPADGGGGAHVALLCPFLIFLIKMDNFQPNKLSQRSVKIPYGIKPYNV